MKAPSLAATLTLIASPALAHGGHAADGLWHGLLHPLAGPDHLLAMLAVGLWSGFVLPRRVWAGAAVFLAAMLAGAAVALAGIGFAGVEGAIVGSVLVFGLLTLAARAGQAGWQTGLTLLAIGGFALAHGHAHATEATGAITAYVVGVLVATAGLHLAGIVLARALAGQRGAQQTLGAGIAVSGLWLIAG